MKVAVLDNIDRVSAKDWNRLSGNRFPFLRHEFLAALEHNGCVGERHGWLPAHLVLQDDHDRLLGAVPLYRKLNSHGEFVFDWSWADAYERAGLAYYPKLVAAAPYTPAPGPRLLLAPGADRDTVVNGLIRAALELCRADGCSSLHWLFTSEEDTDTLTDRGLLRRLGCQFHWHNRDYRDFTDFLSALNARKRKKLKRERRYVRESGLTLKVMHGDEASESELASMYEFYRSIYDRKWGFPTLNLDFFLETADTMGQNIVLILAFDNKRPVAGAFNLRGADTLYGRYWGCNAAYHSLHFEACYYQGIEYCIHQGLSRFEPGAQGEHKISRGFLPTPTWSAHWIEDERFRAIIGNHLEQEIDAVQDQIRKLRQQSPYRQTETGDLPGTSAKV